MTEETSLPKGTRRAPPLGQAGAQCHAIDILSVLEIRGWSRPIALRNAAGHVRGVINRRETVLPVLDPAVRLGHAAEVPNAQSAIIVVETTPSDVGLLVGAVPDRPPLSCDPVPPVPGPAAVPPAGPVGAPARHADCVTQALDLEAVTAARCGCAHDRNGHPG